MAKNRFWLLALTLLSAAVLCVIFVLGYLLVTLPAPPAVQAAPTPTATIHRPVLDLPTVPPPTATAGPPPPIEVKFIARKPVKGFSNCRAYGFKGVVEAKDGGRLPGIQVVVWRDRGGGLLALATTDRRGLYSIEVKDKPAQRKLWVQIYQNDIPVSEPLLVKTQLDCQNGFQIFQIDWQEKGE